MVETNCLMRWARRTGKFGPFAVTGISLGGIMAALAGTICPHKVAIIPCISPYSAAPVFADDILRDSVDWNALSSRLPVTKGSTVQDAKKFLKDLLDVTDLRTYPKPKTPEASIVVSASFDEYLPQAGEILSSHWGAELRNLQGGHVASLLWGHSSFVEAIVDAIHRLQKLN